MLKGVANINSNSGAENSSKNIYRRILTSGIIRHEDVHDSLNISQGYRILKEYDLNLKKFRKNSKGLLEIQFDLSEIQFATLMDIENLTNFLKFDFDLKFIKDSPKFSASLFTKTHYSDHIQNYLKINNITFLMERINSLDVSSEINISNTRALSNLMDGAYNGILSEFKLINSILVRAAKNTFNFDIKHDPLSDVDNELILIQKITPFNESA